MTVQTEGLSLFLEGVIDAFTKCKDNDIQAILAVGSGTARLVSDLPLSAYTHDELLEIGRKNAYYTAGKAIDELSQNGGIRNSDMTYGQLFERGNHLGILMATSLTADRLADEGKIGNTLKWDE